MAAAELLLPLAAAAAAFRAAAKLLAKDYQKLKPLMFFLSEALLI